ncbi:WGR domain-containing protein [Massilia sp. DJPM01]|uniref:WGR domain-containing protein n=1 Tax=Massilia sp. DJPM01 TaxID=3024404 RepID=UPI00259F9A3D|nr:WGR domain-containing protein [Massilia sp. DJPM01]MDM5178373.1 WGR domain-containing protein [Massilia sp. DJPM01]
MRRFDYDQGASDKFREVDQDGCDVHVRYGKVGAAGQRQTKTHPDHATAAAMDKLIREKTGKGYAESGAAPWLAVEPLVDISPEVAALAMPSRRFPGVARDIDICAERDNSGYSIYDNYSEGDMLLREQASTCWP